MTQGIHGCIIGKILEKSILFGRDKIELLIIPELIAPVGFIS